MSTRTYEVDPGDPHNDQLAALTAVDLTKQLENVQHVLDQAEESDAPLSAVLAVIAQSLIDQDGEMPRDRLASLLALALVRLAAEARSPWMLDCNP
jgi:hypothetical protein